MDETMLIEAHDSTLWRIERVQKSIKVACAILGITKHQLEVLVYRIADQKGELQIMWFHAWTAQQEQAFQIAWGICGESNVHHELAVF